MIRGYGTGQRRLSIQTFRKGLIQKGLVKIRSALFRAYKEESGSDVMDYPKDKYEVIIVDGHSTYRKVKGDERDENI